MIEEVERENGRGGLSEVVGKAGGETLRGEEPLRARNYLHQEQRKLLKKGAYIGAGILALAAAGAVAYRLACSDFGGLAIDAGM